MKNLVAKVGTVTTATLLATAIAPVMEAEALVLNASRTGTIVRGQANSSSPVIDQELLIFDPFFADAGAVEVGEFLLNESRAFAEYDLSPFLSVDFFDPSTTFEVAFDVFTKGGTNSAGSSGLGNNAGNPYNGIINVSWYNMAGSVFDLPVTFDPALPPGGVTSLLTGFTTPLNPLATLSMADYSAGDRISIDVSSLVKDLLANPFPSTPDKLGLMLWADPNDAAFDNAGSLADGAGKCGANFNRACVAVTFNNFGITEVPTPAAILPSLLGIFSAAFRKKKGTEEES